MARYGGQDPRYAPGEPQPPAELPDPDKAEAERRIAALLRANRRRARRDPEGMIPDVPWRPWP